MISNIYNKCDKDKDKFLNKSEFLEFSKQLNELYNTLHGGTASIDEKFYEEKYDIVHKYFADGIAPGVKLSTLGAYAKWVGT